MWLLWLLAACGGTPLDACGRYRSAVDDCFAALSQDDTDAPTWGPDITCPSELTEDEVSYFECLEEAWSSADCASPYDALEAAVQAEVCGRDR